MSKKEIKHNPKVLMRIAKGYYNIELVLKHNKRLEYALKQILKRVESGYPDKEKIKSIEKILNEVKDYLW